MKSILVTGGAGFIGSHVVKALLDAGHAARVLDFLGPPTHDGKAPAWLDSRAELIKGDVRNKADWEQSLAGVDAVIHLAAYMDNHPDVSTYIRTNIESIALMFEVIAEKKLPIKKIIAASSQSVYGEGKYACSSHGEQYLPPRAEQQLVQHDWERRCPLCDAVMEPVPEKETDELHPQIPYGVSKMAAERLLLALGKNNKIPTVSLRYSIALGPHQSFRHFYSGALRAFAVNVLSNDPISMNEDAQQMRDFVDVRDVAAVHGLVLGDDRANDQVFNVGCGRPTRVMELAKTVAEAGGVEFHPLLTNRYRAGDARHQLMSADKLKALGWQLKYSLADSVKDYIEWLRQFGDLKNVLEANYKELHEKGVLRHI